MTILKLYRVGIPNVLTTEFNLQNIGDALTF